MALQTHYKDMFTDSVRFLAGSPKRSLLKTFASKRDVKGQVAYLDSVSPLSGMDTRAGNDWTDLKDKPTQKAYYDAGTETFEEYKKTLVPHQEINRQRTLVTPKLIERSHWFDEDEDIFELTDPQGKTINALMRDIFYSEDKLILDALRAASVQRGGRLGTSDVSAVDFPASQQLTVENDNLYLDLEGISKIRELWDDKYMSDSKIYAVISPTQKRLMINNNEKIHDYDFVSRRGWFEKGELPDIYGVHFIVHPQVIDTEFLAWSDGGITWANFRGLRSWVKSSPAHRDQDIFYISEKADCVREDDNLVVQGTIQSPA